jgi:hypothetical protein
LTRSSNHVRTIFCLAGYRRSRIDTFTPHSYHAVHLSLNRLIHRPEMRLLFKLRAQKERIPSTEPSTLKSVATCPHAEPEAVCYDCGMKGPPLLFEPLKPVKQGQSIRKSLWRRWLKGKSKKTREQHIDIPSLHRPRCVHPLREHCPALS